MNQDAIQEIDALVQELIEVGRKRPDDLRGRGASSLFSAMSGKTRTIGKRLDELGGLKTMLYAHDRASTALGGSSGRELEMIWDGIGNWGG